MGNELEDGSVDGLFMDNKKKDSSLDSLRQRLKPYPFLKRLPQTLSHEIRLLIDGGETFNLKRV